MRPSSIGRNPERNQYRAGFISGIITTVSILIVGVAGIHLAEWAQSTEVIPAFLDALTRPVLSVTDLLTLAFLGGIVIVVIGLLTRYHGGAA